MEWKDQSCGIETNKALKIRFNGLVHSVVSVYEHQDWSPVIVVMEPTFVATPYVTASVPSSQKIRALLDEEEEQYMARRLTRKQILHPFASPKLNSPLKILAEKPATVTKPLWMSLSSPPPMQQENTMATQRRPSSRTSELGASSRCKTPSTNLSTTTLAGSVSAPLLLPRITNRSGNGNQMTAHPRRVGFLVLDEDNRQELEAAALADARRRAVNKQLQQHLYEFHTRQVFSFAKSSEEEEDEQEATGQCQEEGPISSSRSMESERQEAESIESASQDPQQSDINPADFVLPELSFLTPQHYDAIFDADWRASDVEKVVRDAVDRHRIYGILQRAYRMIIWFSRYYAGKCALAENGGSATMSVLAGINNDDIFQIPSTWKLLEDLNIPMVDPNKHGVTDSVVRREQGVGMLLAVARMVCAHPDNPARHRMLVAEGIEMSTALRDLMRDHLLAYAQIQDVNHFRRVFLRKAPDGSRRLELILSRHRLNLKHFYEEQLNAAPVTKQLQRPPLGAVRVSSNSSLPGQTASMTCAQFLSALRSVKMLSSTTSTSTSSTTTSSGASPAPASAPLTGEGSGFTTAANAVATVDESKALRVFLSCLSVRPTDDTNGHGTRRASFEQFVEALLRVALLRRELEICRGAYDVCPGQVHSALCGCQPETTPYSFPAFDRAVEELCECIHSHRLSSVQKRTVVKVRSMRTLHLGGKQNRSNRLQSQLMPSFD